MGLVLRRKVEMVAPQVSKERRVEARPPSRLLIQGFFPIIFFKTTASFQSPASGSGGGAPVAVDPPSSDSS